MTNYRITQAGSRLYRKAKQNDMYKICFSKTVFEVLEALENGKSVSDLKADPQVLETALMYLLEGGYIGGC